MRQKLAVLSIVVVLALLVALWWLWPSPAAHPPEGGADAPADVEPEHRTARPPTLRTAGVEAHPEAPEKQPTGGLTEANALLAELSGMLHVRCWVGEEYAELRFVDTDGWMSFLTRERNGYPR
ncbi:MAG: hypothetical protein KC656_18925 [Myxococcales bacterium]|nr:hypothetical protein [Myxococcales bacterium]